VDLSQNSAHVKVKTESRTVSGRAGAMGGTMGTKQDDKILQDEQEMGDGGVLGAWCLVLGAWCLVLGAWCLVLGAWAISEERVQ
jgi:hypothetical protein